MNTPLRRTLLALAAALGLYVGVWAAVAPDAFWRSFPGFGLHWIDLDGGYNEHLIRDVGDFYLALATVSVVAAAHRSALPDRIAGLAWAVFGVLHFGYHLIHPEGSVIDVAGTIASLAVSAALGIVLATPSRRGADAAPVTESAPGAIDDERVAR